jgi:hypothetical protein
MLAPAARLDARSLAKGLRYGLPGGPALAPDTFRRRGAWHQPKTPSRHSQQRPAASISHEIAQIEWRAVQFA